MDAFKMNNLFFSFLFSYLSTAFVQWHYNPSVWTEHARFVCVVVMFVLFFIVTKVEDMNE
jgi:hypothetical protein